LLAREERKRNEARKNEGKRIKSNFPRSSTI
jgi:hypothetical protein